LHLAVLRARRRVQWVSRDREEGREGEIKTPKLRALYPAPAKLQVFTDTINSSLRGVVKK
jgi:hypothetical protein